MSSGFPSRRRGSLVISIAILEAARNGIRKTHLMGSVAMSYEQFSRYVEFLEVNGFVEKWGDLYRTTGKGLDLVAEFDSSPLTRSILVT